MVQEHPHPQAVVRKVATRQDKAVLLVILFAITLAFVDADTPWPRHAIDASSQGADGVRLQDVNADSFPDIATAWEEGSVIRAYLHPGPSAATVPWPKVTVGAVSSGEDAVFVDLDSDGAMDVVSACEGKTRTLHVHWAPKDSANLLDPKKWTTDSFPTGRERVQWMYTLPIDADGKNGIDLLVAGKGPGAEIGWLLSPKDPRDLETWRFEPLYNVGWIMSIRADDIDGDGDLDVLYSDRKGTARGVYWLKRENDTWQRHLIGGTDHEYMFLSTGDLDQDGRRDIICATKGGPIVWYRRLENAWSAQEIPLPDGVGGGKGTAIGDIDGNGRQDIVFSCEGADKERSGVRWLSWETDPSAGIWHSHEISGPAGIKFDRLELNDIDQDGDLDVLTCEERDQLGVIWYENPHITQR